MNEELVKSLTSLIDETIAEIEDLKKSRFAASEIKLAGPGEDGIHGHKADGKLDKEEDDKKDEKDEDKKDKKEMDKKEEDDKKDKKDEKKDDKDGDMDKAEGHNRQSDPDGGKHKPVAGEGDKHGQGPSSSPGGSNHHSNGKNREADPNGGNHKMDKSDGYPVDLKRSVDESNTLMKSYIDSKVAPLETKLAGILDLVKKIADQPVAAKGATTKNFAVLHKSAGEGKETLSKSQVANKLFELKKSGKFVDSADITAAELGSSDLQAIVTKYGLQ